MAIKKALVTVPFVLPGYCLNSLYNISMLAMQEAITIIAVVIIGCANINASNIKPNNILLTFPPQIIRIALNSCSSPYFLPYLAK